MMPRFCCGAQAWETLKHPLNRAAKGPLFPQMQDARREPGVTLERVMGIEPTYEAWEAAVLPLNYTRGGSHSKGNGKPERPRPPSAG